MVVLLLSHIFSVCANLLFKAKNSLIRRLSYQQVKLQPIAAVRLGYFKFTLSSFTKKQVTLGSCHSVTHAVARSDLLTDVLSWNEKSLFREAVPFRCLKLNPHNHALKVP